MLRSLRPAAAMLGAACLACSSGFQLARYQTNDALYAAGVEQFRARHWDNAVAVFERLTLQLPARDTLLPRAHWFLGQAHKERDEPLLAAQSFVRLVESFPADSLADDALYEAAYGYQQMWRKPELDPQYGETAVGTYQTLVAAYPDSPRVADAEREIARLHEWMARRDFETADYYERRRAYDSAIIYYQDVIEQYPATPTARRAAMQMLGIYRRLKYKEEADEVCAGMRTRQPGDAEVERACGPAPSPSAPVRGPPDSTATGRR